MSDLAERVRALGERVEAGYDAGRIEIALAGVRTKLHRRRARRIALGSAVSVVCLGVGALWAMHSHHPAVPSPVTPLAAQGESLFALSDGSVVTSLNPASRVLAKTVSPQLVELELLSGSAQFDVAPNRERAFKVDAGRVGITVVGTKFTVERQGERTAITVQAGRVRVAWERGEQLLNPGERGVFPPFEMAPAVEEPASGASEPPTVPARGSARRAAEWHGPHGDGAAVNRTPHDKAAPESLASVDELLLAADAARTSGRAVDSVRYLERALALHESDARAAVVAFTLGRVLLADLHDSARAAEAFAKARAAAPRGPLAEDALAREIEARHGAGEDSRARALAEEYLKTWPSGARVRAVRHFGGLP